MSGKWPRGCAVIALLALAGVAWADAPHAMPGMQTRVTLGDAATVSTLFSWPNNNDGQTRAQTAAHYLRQSLRRDGLSGATVKVEAEGGVYYAVLAHAPPGYAKRLTRFLEIGARGARATAALRHDGKWNAQQWRFFLPLGLALQNQKAVQLLHFPPASSLTRQDYLNTATSRRWETLLELNGVPRRRVARYERIVDIAPVAAPADAGATLADTYDAYRHYARAMLEYSIATRRVRRPLPVVACGGPVRRWVQANLGVRLRVSAAPRYVKVGNTARVPMLGANHPGLFWHVAKRSRIGAVRVMRDDLVAACWQVRMGNAPSRSIRQTLKQCTGYWDMKPVEVCEQTEIQGYHKTPRQARRMCARSAYRLMHAALALYPGDLRHFDRVPWNRKWQQRDAN